jgi:hypothetical protein
MLAFIESVQESFLHSQHTKHQLSLDGTGLSGLDSDSVNSSSDYFVYLCTAASESTLHKKECQLPIDLTFNNRLYKSIAKNELC